MNLKETFLSAQTGDRDAFDSLLEHYRTELSSFIRSQLGQRLRARVEETDILQEATLRAIRSLEGVEWKGEKQFRNWLFGIAFHVIQEHARRFLRWSEAPEDSEPTDGGTSATRQARRHERFDRLEAAIDRLSEDHRRVLKMTRIDGMQVREVAKLMDRSEKATYQLLWRATQRLKEIFGETASLRLPDRRIGDA